MENTFSAVLGLSGVGERALDARGIASFCNRGAWRLVGSFRSLLNALGPLGRVKTTTRNRSAVMERWGGYWKPWPSRDEWRGGISSSNVRHCLHRWRAGFALDASFGEERNSFLFFDEAGDLIHQIRVPNPAAVPAYEQLCRFYLSVDQSTTQERPQREPSRVSPREIDLDSFRASWDALLHLNELSGLLRRFGLSRPVAFSLAGDARATQVAPSEARTFLQRSVALSLPLRIAVSNAGTTQAHGTLFQHFRANDGWLTVERPNIRVRLKESQIAQAWIVRRPTRFGTTFSLELFDAEGLTIAMLLFHGTADQPEHFAWTELLQNLRRAEDSAVSTRTKRS